MTSVGKLLRSAREQQKRSLAEIAEELCITQRYLRAIEQDDLADLPGAFFYKSFVRQYASVLGVSTERVQQAVEQVIAASEPPSEPSGRPKGETSRAEPQGAPRPRILESMDRLWSNALPTTPLRPPDPMVQNVNRYISDRRIGMSVATLAFVLIACSGFYAWWTRTPLSAADVLTSTAEPAPQLAAPAPAAAAAVAVANPEESRASPASAVLIPTTPGLDGTTMASLNIAASEATWVSITSAGKLIFAGILQPSQTKTLTGIDAAQMKVGNAGGLEVSWKGKPIGPIGRRGEVKTVVFKPDDVQILTPPPPEPTAPPGESTL